MEGEIPMAARRHVTNKLRTAYRKALKADRGRILDEVMATTGVGRSTARRLLTGPHLPDPAAQVDRRQLRTKTYSDDSRFLLEHVWALMGCPCGKYLTVMLPIWLPLLEAAGDLGTLFATPATVMELQAMSPATIDRYLGPARQRMQVRGISTTTPAPAVLRNSIGLSKAGDERPTTPGVIEADTVAHCGPTLVGEFARTLTMTDLVTGWTENTSIRNNASRWIVGAVSELQGMFPFPMRVFDSAPKTPWQRVLESGLLSDEQSATIQARNAGVNPADLTRRINHIQLRLIEHSRGKNEALATARGLDMASLEPSIRRLQTTK